MYQRSARYYDLLHRFNDYPGAATRLHAAISERHAGARSLLDVGCGTGQHLAALGAWYEVEGVDISPELLAVAKDRLGPVPLHAQDMAALDTGRRYDVVCCLFGAVAYVRTPSALSTTIRRFREHLAPGGLMVIEPYYPPDRYWTDRVTLDVADTPELKVVRMYASTPPVDRIAGLEIHHLVGTPQGVESFVEHHELGLFDAADFRAAFAAAGLHAEHVAEGFFGWGAYFARVVDAASAVPREVPS